MSKYLEELSPGDLFTTNDSKYILTADFTAPKHDKHKRMCVNILNGFINWINGDTVVSNIDLYYRDNDSNIIALKEYKNEYKEQNSNLS